MSECDVAYLTAGAAGMYCGSCMHDNTLVRALRHRDIDACLIPTYTPIRTDETENLSDTHLFFGGINVYLQQRWPWFGSLPNFLVRWLDRPTILRWATGRGISISPAQLGALTVSMLEGREGKQRREVERLCEWLASETRPRAVHLTNLLIGGSIPLLRDRLKVPIVVTLQGDDLFLEGLPRDDRRAALDLCRRLADQVDQFVCYSRDYAEFMTDYLNIPRERISVVPLGIDVDAIATGVASRRGERLGRRIGYLARLAPEKGFHVLVDAFVALKKRDGMENVELHAAGWLGPDQREYAAAEFAKLDTYRLKEDFTYHGSVTREEKLEFLASCDVISVPATYREPKGLYVMEALAAGVPVVQPAIGVFPEVVQRTGGGRIVPPSDSGALAEELAHLMTSSRDRDELGSAGQRGVQQHYNLTSLADAMIAIYQQLW